jgi:hypothetical protein
VANDILHFVLGSLLLSREAETKNSYGKIVLYTTEDDSVRKILSLDLF